MGRTTYCQPVDVLRKFDPTLVADDLATAEDLLYGESPSGAEIDGMDRLYSRIEEVEDEFDEKTRNPQRLSRVGGTTGVYEFHEADFRRYQGGVRVFLDHRNIEPIDASAGDSIEVRTGIDSWRDITTGEGDQWRMNYSDGILQLIGYYRYSNQHWGRAVLDDNIRVNYRYGALGGGRRKPGQSSLSSTLSEGEVSTMSVDDAARFPSAGGVVLVDDEYVRYESADRDGDTLDSLTRGVRGTSDSEHSTGDVVHYCPMSVRSAVAAKCCVELISYEDWVAELISTGQEMGVNGKVEGWNSEWESALGRFSEAKVL